MPRKLKVNKQLNPGRPRTAVDKSNLPEKETTPIVGELPKTILGSHMQAYLPIKPKGGPAIPRPAKPSAKPRQAPPN